MSCGADRNVPAPDQCRQKAGHVNGEQVALARAVQIAADAREMRTRRLPADLLPPLSECRDA